MDPINASADGLAAPLARVGRVLGVAHFQLLSVISTIGYCPAAERCLSHPCSNHAVPAGAERSDGAR